MEVVQPIQENIIEKYVQIAREKFYFHPNLTREDIFLIAARIFACHIKPLKSGTLTVLPNMMSVYSAPPDFVHKGEHMNLIDDIVNRVYESKLPQVPYVNNGKTDWTNINPASFELHGTPTGIIDEISGTRPGANEPEHSPYDVIHFRDDEATDVFDGVDSSKYHGMFQILNKLRDRVSGNIPLAKGMRYLPATKAFTMVAAVHSGEVSKAILSSGNLRRINLISVPYSEIIDDSQGLRNEVLYYFDEWKKRLFTHLDNLNQMLYNTEISFTWEKDVEDVLVSIRNKAVNEVRKQRQRYTYDPEERVYFLMLYGMYSSLLNKHMRDVGVFEITMSDLMYAQYHLNQLKEGYKQEIREFLPDDVQSIYEAVMELINEEWESTHNGITQTMIYKSPKVPITTKVMKKSGKTKANILNAAIAEALRNEEIKGVEVKSVNAKTIKSIKIYFPFNVSDEDIKSIYPDFQLIYS